MTISDKIKALVTYQVLKDLELYFQEAEQAEDGPPDNDENLEDDVLERKVDFYVYMDAVLKGETEATDEQILEALKAYKSGVMDAGQLWTIEDEKQVQMALALRNLSASADRIFEIRALSDL